MRMNLYGYRDVDMKGEDGRPILGVSLYVGYPNDGVEGEQTAKIFINRALQSRCTFVPVVGAPIDVEYGPSNRVVGVRILDK